MTRISVVVPVYNCEEYLEQCIKSVLNQTIKQTENLYSLQFYWLFLLEIFPDYPSVHCFLLYESFCLHMQKAVDLLKGVMDNLIFAQKHRLDILFHNTVDRLEYEYFLRKQYPSKRFYNIVRCIINITNYLIYPH